MRSLLLMDVKVYPRGCGGTFRFDNKDGRGTGLSPRVRGNPGDGLA